MWTHNKLKQSHVWHEGSVRPPEGEMRRWRWWWEVCRLPECPQEEGPKLGGRDGCKWGCIGAGGPWCRGWWKEWSAVKEEEEEEDEEVLGRRGGSEEEEWRSGCLEGGLDREGSFKVMRKMWRKSEVGVKRRWRGKRLTRWGKTNKNNENHRKWWNLLLLKDFSLMALWSCGSIILICWGCRETSGFWRQGSAVGSDGDDSRVKSNGETKLLLNV